MLLLITNSVGHTIGRIRPTRPVTEVLVLALFAVMPDAVRIELRRERASRATAHWYRST